MQATPYQRDLSTRLATRLGSLGYRVERDYQFSDILKVPSTPRQVPVVAFSHAPLSQESACLAVIYANGRSGPSFVNEHRALGALMYFELREQDVRVWKVGATEHETNRVGQFSGRDVLAFVEDNQAVLRAENVHQARLFPDRRRQLDFFDFGLPLTLEGLVSERLHELLEAAVAAGVAALPRAELDRDLKRISETTFDCLAAKILNDRGVHRFALDADAPDEAVRQVRRHYGDERPAVRLPRAAVIAIAQNVWTRLDLSNVSPTVLSYVYERTLVTAEQRKKLGTHGTPLSLARFIVGQMPWDSYAPEGRKVFEPCCGHSVFLLAAMSSLSALWDGGDDQRRRHAYLRSRLSGMDVDQFALEIGKLSLMLADWPNANGWNLQVGDVFREGALAAGVAQADVVLCNPPFEDFSGGPPAGVESQHKPVALLQQLLQHAKPGASFGLVLPQAFLDGRSYSGVRRALAERFRRVRIMSLPDNVFRSSEAETAVFIGMEARPANWRGSSVVVWSSIGSRDAGAFLSRHHIPREAVIEKSWGEFEESVRVAPASLWRSLESFPVIRDVAVAHRGIEWMPGTSDADRFASKGRPGFARGLERVEKTLVYAFARPIAQTYLSLRRGVVKNDPLKYPWAMPKVVMNAARCSRGRWCIRAFADHEGLVVSQRFHVLWPIAPWTARSLAAVLNGPVANGYMSEHSGKRDLQKRAVVSIPVPCLTVDEIDALDRDVGALETAMRADRDSGGAALLARIDARVLAGYGIEGRLDVEFADEDVRPVPWPWRNVFTANAFARTDQSTSDEVVVEDDYLDSPAYRAMVKAVNAAHQKVEREGQFLLRKLGVVD
jgi:type I restriction-modification system DNA methylase subunit